MTLTATRNPLLTALVLLTGPLLYLSFGYTEMAGSDMWWHVAAGRELVQTGSPWMVDDWSYTELGSDWLNHEWLSDLIYYGWVSLFGIESLVYWKWLVLISAFTLLQLATTRTSGNQLAGLLCAGCAAAIAAPFLDVRPHLYTLLNYCLLLYLLLGRQASRMVLAPLFVVWVNLHGGFFFGLMALAILLFPWRELSVKTLRVAAVTGLICLLLATLNPSGFGTFLYPLKYAFDETSPFRTLGEWLPPYEAGGIRSPLFFVFQWAPLLALLYLLPAVRRRTGIPWEGICLTLLTLAMAVTSRRFIPIFAISLAVLLAPLVGLVFAQVKHKVLNVMLASLALLIAVLRLLPYPLQSGPAFHYLVAEYSYPVDTVNYMEVNNLSGKVYAYYNWGGYLHWRTDGRLKVYIDGRADTLFDAPTYNSYVSVLHSEPGWRERIEATEPDFILWPNRRGRGAQKLRELVESGKWRGLYQDAESALLVRADLQLSTHEPPPETPWRHLTQAWGHTLNSNAPLAIAYSARARETMPWNKRACEIAYTVQLQTGNEAEAAKVFASCHRFFPGIIRQR